MGNFLGVRQVIGGIDPKALPGFNDLSVGICEYAGELNPWMQNALNFEPQPANPNIHPMDQEAQYNQQFGGGFQGAMNQMVQNPGYIDPRLMNMNLNMSNQMGQGAMQNFQTQIGRSGMMGGLSDAYALANQGATAQRNMGLFQNYNLARESQRRGDINFTMNQIAGQNAQAGNMLRGQAQIQQSMPPSMSGWAGAGNVMSAAAGAYGGMQGMSAAPGGGGMPNPYQYGGGA